MDSAKVGILEERDEVGLSGFLEGKHSLALEPNFLFPLLGNLSDNSLEGELSDKQVGLN